MDIKIFIGIASIGVLLQAGCLLGILLRRITSRFEALSDDVRITIFPAVESAYLLVKSVGPNIKKAAEDLSETTYLLRRQIVNLDSRLSAVSQRAHGQIARVDELITTGLDRVDQTADMVDRVVKWPLARISGLMQKLNIALDYFQAGRSFRGRWP